MNLQQIVLRRIALGHAYGKMSVNSPSREQRIVMAEDELNGMTHSEFLELLSSALEDMLPTDDSAFMRDDEGSD